MANFLYFKDLEKKWSSIHTENHPDTQPLLEADVEAVATVRPQKPSKSCLIITGILALFFILVGIAIVAVIEGIVPGPVEWFQSQPR